MIAIDVGWSQNKGRAPVNPALLPSRNGRRLNLLGHSAAVAAEHGMVAAGSVARSSSAYSAT